MRISYIHTFLKFCSVSSNIMLIEDLTFVLSINRETVIEELLFDITSIFNPIGYVSYTKYSPKRLASFSMLEERFS
jgi:hypothetical protein